MVQDGSGRQSLSFRLSMLWGPLVCLMGLRRIHFDLVVAFVWIDVLLINFAGICGFLAQECGRSSCGDRQALVELSSARISTMCLFNQSIVHPVFILIAEIELNISIRFRIPLLRRSFRFGKTLDSVVFVPALLPFFVVKNGRLRMRPPRGIGRAVTIVIFRPIEHYGVWCD